MAPQTLNATRDVVHPRVDARGGGNVNQNHFIEHSKLLPWLMLTAIFSGMAMSGIIFCYIYVHDIHESDRDEIVLMKHEMGRMATHLMSNDALLLRERIIQPGDMFHGPEGNLEYGRKDQPNQRTK